MGHVRQRLQLCRRQSARIGSAAQKNQRCEFVEQAAGLNGGRDQDQERVQQGKPSVHHLEQLVKDERQRHIGHGDHDVRHQAEPVEQLMRLDVVCRGCRITRHNQDGGNDADGEGACDDVDQVQGAANSGQLARRSVRNGIHQWSPSTRVDDIDSTAGVDRRVMTS